MVDLVFWLFHSNFICMRIEQGPSLLYNVVVFRKSTPQTYVRGRLSILEVSTKRKLRPWFFKRTPKMIIGMLI